MHTLGLLVIFSFCIFKPPDVGFNLHGVSDLISPTDYELPKKKKREKKETSPKMTHWLEVSQWLL